MRKVAPAVALFGTEHADARGACDYDEALSVDRSNAIAEQIFQPGDNRRIVTKPPSIKKGRIGGTHRGKPRSANGMRKSLRDRILRLN
ncbi:hypothetical protein [Novosphingobium sp. BL-52-GroH]